MNRFAFVILSFVVLAGVTSSVNGLRCYDCHNARCSEAIEGKAEVDCAPDEVCASGITRFTNFDGSIDYAMNRHCTRKTHDLGCHDFTKEAVIPFGLVKFLEVCTCDTDLCNGCPKDVPRYPEDHLCVNRTTDIPNPDVTVVQPRLTCHECDTHNDTKCMEGPGAEHPVVQCRPNSYCHHFTIRTEEPGKPPVATFVVRGCVGKSHKTVGEKGCYKQALEEHVFAEYCHCNGEKCNHCTPEDPSCYKEAPEHKDKDIAEQFIAGE
jgi:hypothetical protein